MNATRVSVEEHPDTAYSPNRECVDGVVGQRHVEGRLHSTLDEVFAGL